MASLLGMIGEGRIAELTDLELVAVVMMTAPERAEEVLRTVLPGIALEPTAEDVMKLRAKDGDNVSKDKVIFAGPARQVEERARKAVEATSARTAIAARVGRLVAGEDGAGVRARELAVRASAGWQASAIRPCVPIAGVSRARLEAVP